MWINYGKYKALRIRLAVSLNYLPVKLVERMTYQCGTLHCALSKYRNGSGVHFYLNPSLGGLFQSPQSELLG